MIYDWVHESESPGNPTNVIIVSAVSPRLARFNGIDLEILKAEKDGETLWKFSGGTRSSPVQAYSRSRNRIDKSTSECSEEAFVHTILHLRVKASDHLPMLEL